MYLQWSITIISSSTLLQFFQTETKQTVRKAITIQILLWAYYSPGIITCIQRLI
ncbi:MAG: hypothetical protein EOO93_19445 [Pedobacter sp.]|nr:MAG: hypothetical protein EOO93_19445 [Pedobacter sp.]